MAGLEQCWLLVCALFSGYRLRVYQFGLENLLNVKNRGKRHYSSGCHPIHNVTGFKHCGNGISNQLRILSDGGRW